MPASEMLSKSLYLKGLGCSKALWLKKNKPIELAPPDAATLAVFETGNDVGELAYDLFPGGNKITFEGSSMDEKIQLTKKWMEEGIIKCIED